MAVYLVSTPTGEHLVESNNQAAAINAVVRATVKARAVTASELLAYLRAGASVQATSEQKNASSVDDTDQALTDEAA
jgi:hypothetical protein